MCEVYVLSPPCLASVDVLVLNCNQKDFSVGSLRAFHLLYQKKKKEAKSMDPHSLRKKRFCVAVFQLCCVQMPVIAMNWQQEGGGGVFLGWGCCCSLRAALRACSASSASAESQGTSHPQWFLLLAWRQESSLKLGVKLYHHCPELLISMGLALVSSSYPCQKRPSCPRMAPGFHLSLEFCAQRKEFTSHTTHLKNWNGTSVSSSEGKKKKRKK